MAVVMSLPPVPNMPVPGIGNFTGPMLLGHLFNWALFGALGVQLYIWITSFPKERRLVKVIVYLVFGLDLLQTAATTHYAWYVLASGWGNQYVLVYTTWTLSTIPPLASAVALAVQSFFAWRIFALQLPKRFMFILVLIATTGVTAFGLSMWLGIISQDPNDVRYAFRLDKGVTAWLSLSVICDLLITVTLVVQLSHRKGQGFGTYNGVLHRTIRMSLETGALTAAVVCSELGLYLHSSTSAWYFTTGMIIGKLYSNSLLATLNARSNGFRSQDATEQHSEVHVWRPAAPIEVSMGTAVTTSVQRTTKDIELGSFEDQSRRSHKV